MSEAGRKTIWIMLAFFAIFAFAFNAHAAYPDKPIKILVGHGAGGSTDVVARTFAAFLSKYLKNPVVVNNMPGGGGRIMLNNIKSEPADGYTLCMVVTPSYINVQLLRKPSWDLTKFTYMGGVGGGDSTGLVVSYDSKIKTFDELLALSKKEPVTLAGTSVGSNSWLMATMLGHYVKGFKFEYVPYDSGNKATMAIVGGHVTVGVASTINFPDLVKEKKIRVLGVASEKRLTYVPDAPTFVEMGYPEVEIVTRQVFGGAPGLAKDVAEKLTKATQEAVSDPEFLKLAARQGFSVDPMSAAQTAQMVDKTYKSIQKVLKETGALK